MWTGHGAILIGGRAATDLATSDLWHFDWASRCWMEIAMPNADWQPTQQAREEPRRCDRRRG